MTMHMNKAGVKVPKVLLPNKNVDMTKWAVVACDQFTSQPDYWAATEKNVGEAPSTLRLMLPEMYLDKPDEAERIKNINATMERYIEDGTLEEKGCGFVYVKRTVSGRTRSGLIMALDLENYDYSKGSTSLIRATEGTIVERIPPRLRIRKDASLELPHILVLIDDPDRTVIEPIGESADKSDKLYDFELMQNGGHIEGYFVGDDERIDGVLRALESLMDKDTFNKKYSCDLPPLLFAMGDGNHSFATAKANWELVKQGLTEEEKLDHPARYALIELENVHDDGIIFEPIHRVLFNLDSDAAIAYLKEKLSHDNGGCTDEFYPNKAARDEAMAKHCTCEHLLPYMTEAGYGFLAVKKPVSQLEVGTLQSALDTMLKAMPGVTIDYVHGEDVVDELSRKHGNMGFILPKMEKSAFFRTVIFDGALPRKTFSMGEANEKRYYLECRKISK